MHREGFEPTTGSLEESGSIHLSDRRDQVVNRRFLAVAMASSPIILPTAYCPLSSAPGRSRTCNPPLKRRRLCHLSYECNCSKYNQFQSKCTGEGSNLHSPASQAGALPIKLPVPV